MNEFENLNLEELQTVFQEGNNTLPIKDNRNVVIKCKITKEEAKKGSRKKIKYNRINESGKKEANEIFVKIPEGIKEGQSIVLYGVGNYIEELNGNSHLIIEMELK